MHKAIFFKLQFLCEMEKENELEIRRKKLETNKTHKAEAQLKDKHTKLEKKMSANHTKEQAY